MSNDYDNMTGILDLRDSLVVCVDEEGDVVDVLVGEFPERSNGEPYHHGVIAKDTQGRTILIDTDMDYQTLVSRPYTS